MHCSGENKRFSTGDWFTANFAIYRNAENAMKASGGVRNEACYLRNETDSKTKWDQYDTNVRLSDRVDLIGLFKDRLERYLQRVDVEINNLNVAKDLMESLLLKVSTRIKLNMDNLVMREGRLKIDLVRDEVEDQLLKEQEILSKMRRQIQDKVDQSFEHLGSLQEIRQRLLENLQDKNLALQIDVKQYNLTQESPSVTLKPDPSRTPAGMLTVQQWEDYCRTLFERIEQELTNSSRLRETSHDALMQMESDMAAQNLAVLYALRKRIHQLVMALDQLKYQKKLMEVEMGRVEEEIGRLEKSWDQTLAALKLAHTRSEHRLERPGEELVRDSVKYGLDDEIKQLEATLHSLDDKKRQAQHALDCLEKNLHRINEDIRIKSNSLHIDEQVVASRDKLNPPFPLSTTERQDIIIGGAREQSTLLPL